MTSARKSEIFGILSVFSRSNPEIAGILTDLVKEVKPMDDTRPNKCIVCGRITYYDPIIERHRCQYCGS